MGRRPERRGSKEEEPVHVRGFCLNGDVTYIGGSLSRLEAELAACRDGGFDGIELSIDGLDVMIGGRLAMSATLVEVTGEASDEAARISHGTGIPALDALIIAGLVEAGCRTIYTKDEHFLRYARKGVDIILLD